MTTERASDLKGNSHIAQPRGSSFVVAAGCRLTNDFDFMIRSLRRFSFLFLLLLRSVVVHKHNDNFFFPFHSSHRPFSFIKNEKRLSYLGNQKKLTLINELLCDFKLQIIHFECFCNARSAAFRGGSEKSTKSLTKGFS